MPKICKIIPEIEAASFPVALFSSHKLHPIHDAVGDFQKSFMYHNSPEAKVVCSELNTKITYKHKKINFDECGLELRVIVVFINIIVADHIVKSRGRFM